MLNQLFDYMLTSVFNVDSNHAGEQQLPQQTHAGECQAGGDKKCNFQQSVSKPAENHSGNSNTSVTSNSKSDMYKNPSGGSHDNSSAAACISKDIDGSLKAIQQYTRYGSTDLKSYLCTKYCKSNRPVQSFSYNSGHDGKQINHQMSVDTCQLKN